MRPRYHDNPDLSKAAIVEYLRTVGFYVYDCKQVDIDVRHVSWPPNRFSKIEIKTPNRKVKTGIRLRKDRKTQQEFVALHGIPYISTVDEARVWVMSVT